MKNRWFHSLFRESLRSGVLLHWAVKEMGASLCKFSVLPKSRQMEMFTSCGNPGINLLSWYMYLNIRKTLKYSQICNKFWKARLKLPKLSLELFLLELSFLHTWSNVQLFSFSELTLHLSFYFCYNRMIYARFTLTTWYFRKKFRSHKNFLRKKRELKCQEFCS